MAVEINKAAARIVADAHRVDPDEHNLIDEWTEAREIDRDEYIEFVDQILERINDALEVGMEPEMAIRSGIMLSFQVAYETAAKHFLGSNPLT